MLFHRGLGLISISFFVIVIHNALLLLTFGAIGTSSIGSASSSCVLTKEQGFNLAGNTERTKSRLGHKAVFTRRDSTLQATLHEGSSRKTFKPIKSPTQVRPIPKDDVLCPAEAARENQSVRDCVDDEGSCVDCWVTQARFIERISKFKQNSQVGRCIYNSTACYP